MSEDDFDIYKEYFLRNYETILCERQTCIPFLCNYLGLKVSYSELSVKKLRNILSCDFKVQVCLAVKRSRAER